MNEILQYIPIDLINFIIVLSFSLLIGLEQRVYHNKTQDKLLFGTDRTFTLIGILGFILYIIQPDSLIPFIAGGFGVLVLLSVFYYHQIKIFQHFGLTTIIIALLTYSLAPLLYLNNKVLVLTVFVTIIILTGIKKNLQLFADKFDAAEFLTLAKFIIISGVVLPLLPKTPLLSGYDLSLYKIWIAIIAISGISYFSYILKKFFFPKAGLILTAILGGLYSSTATTIILAKKSKTENMPYKVIAGILSATAMMYIRLLILAFIFNKSIAFKLSPYFILLSLISGGVAYYFYRNKKANQVISTVKQDKNPLEFNTALIFGFLFAFFSVLTDFVVKYYGEAGINILSLIVGVTDVDPFVLNLFQNGLKNLTVEQIFRAVLFATASNNILKLIYVWIFGDKSLRKPVTIGFLIVIILSFSFAIFS